MPDSIRDSILFNPALPSLPSVALEVLDLAAREDVDLRDFERTIERDQAISIRILKTVNSSYYGLGRPCGSIRQAVAYLGVETVKALVLGFSLERAIDGGGDEELNFDFISYWRHSFIRATALRTLATKTGMHDPEEAFLSGLIQDVGKIAFWRVYGDRYLQVEDMSDGCPDHLLKLEREHFEIDHAELSAELTRRWHFPQPITEMVRHHHDDMETIDDRKANRRLARFSVAIVGVLEEEGVDQVRDIERLQSYGMKWFGMDRSQLISMIEGIVRDARNLARALNIKTGRMPSIESIISRANRLLEDIPMENRPVVDREEGYSLDAITGLPDRTSLLSDLESCFRDFRSSNTHSLGNDITLMLIGVDEVRRINERIGDVAGDSAIEHVADCVRSVVKGQPGITGVYRFVGAEIAVILRHVEERRVRNLAESIRERIACTPIRVEGRSGGSDFLVIKSTIGTSMHRASEDGSKTTSPDQLLGSAMCAVTTGRRHGGDRVVMFGDDEFDLSELIKGIA